MLTLSIIYRYLFHILALVFFATTLALLVINENIKKTYELQLTKIEEINTNNRLKLIEEARQKEQELVQEYNKLLEEKRAKDETIKELNATINDNSSRLQQLTKEATRKSQNKCQPTTTTKVVEKVIRVPTSQGSGGDTTEMAFNMAREFEQSAIKCATHYEELKNEATLIEQLNTKEK